MPVARQLCAVVGAPYWWLCAYVFMCVWALWRPRQVCHCQAAATDSARCCAMTFAPKPTEMINRTDLASEWSTKSHTHTSTCKYTRTHARSPTQQPTRQPTEPATEWLSLCATVVVAAIFVCAVVVVTVADSAVVCWCSCLLCFIKVGHLAAQHKTSEHTKTHTHTHTNTTANYIDVGW